MFSPVGPRPPSVYWRRRMVLAGAVVLLVALAALTVSTLAGSDDPPKAAGSSSSPRSSAGSSSVAGSGSGAGTPQTSAGRSGTSSATAAVHDCAVRDLQLTAVVGKPSYPVGASLALSLRVVNAGSVSCQQDVADKQIELRVYNGTSRVWGSHDCAVQPGSQVRTLAVGAPYTFTVEWTGRSSTPGCDPTMRQRVGAGSYTLYGSLAGKQATAAQFSIG